MRFVLSLIRHIKRSPLHHPILHNIITSFRRIWIKRFLACHFFWIWADKLIIKNNSTIFVSANMTIGWNRKMLFQFSHWHYCLPFRMRCRFIPLSSCYFDHGIFALLSYVFCFIFSISFLFVAAVFAKCSMVAMSQKSSRNDEQLDAHLTHYQRHAGSNPASAIPAAVV